MEIFIIFLVVAVIVVLAGQPWRKRGRDSGSIGFFPWTGNDDSSGDSNYHHGGGGHHGHSDGGGHSGGVHGGGDRIARSRSFDLNEANKKPETNFFASGF
jgi:hypothetical protein